MRWPAPKIQSGIGGVIARSPTGFVASLHFSLSSVSSTGFFSSILLSNAVLSKLVKWTSGLGTDNEPLRLRLTTDRSGRTCPAFGAAVIILVGVTDGGGVGESERNRG